MKRSSFTVAAFIFFVIIFINFSCKKEEDNNLPPQCTITYPENGAKIVVGTEVTVSVSAKDMDGAIYYVAFDLGQPNGPHYSDYPYDFLWITRYDSIGWHTIKATSMDNNEVETTAEIQVELIPTGMPCPGAESFTFGGQKYNTVLIGDQCWMRENLNYEHGNSWCYENDPWYCERYGRLYDWETALEVCPDGWHLPSGEEWSILEGTVDSEFPVGDPIWDADGYRGFDAGQQLKSLRFYGENIYDIYGFGALDGGNRRAVGSFFSYSEAGFWWTRNAFELWPESAIFLSIGPGRKTYRGNTSQFKAYSVRCLRDTTVHTP